MRFIKFALTLCVFVASFSHSSQAGIVIEPVISYGLMTDALLGDNVKANSNGFSLGGLLGYSLGPVTLGAVYDWGKMNGGGNTYTTLAYGPRLEVSLLRFRAWVTYDFKAQYWGPFMSMTEAVFDGTAIGGGVGYSIFRNLYIFAEYKRVNMTKMQGAEIAGNLQDSSLNANLIRGGLGYAFSLGLF